MKFQILGVIAALMVSIVPATAANKVVVIPLGGKTDPRGTSYTNTNEMTFNLLPSGSFMMGCLTSGFCGVTAAENPHKVTLTKSFYMQTTEVTNQQWNNIIVLGAIGGANPSSSSDVNHPVDNVTWFEAAAFANMLSESENRTICYDLQNCNLTVALPGQGMTCSSVGYNNNCTGYRLPTEAEWEYAARAGTSTPFANPVYYDTSNTEQGDLVNPNLEAMGWYTYQNAGSGQVYYPGGTHLVGIKQANRWGLYDMHGNVVEWCRDWWDGVTPYSGNANQNTDPTGPLAGTMRVVRGGSCAQKALWATSSARMTFEPKHHEYAIGFRLVGPSSLRK